MPDAVLFDLDGTLADTAPDLGTALNLVREEHNLPPLPLGLLRPHTSQGGRGLLREGMGLLPDAPAYPASYARFLAHYEAGICDKTELFPGMSAVLEELEARSIPWGVVTNKSLYLTLLLLEKMGLIQRCACIVGGDSTPHPKPAPDPLLLAAQQIRRHPQACLYL